MDNTVERQSLVDHLQHDHHDGVGVLLIKGQTSDLSNVNESPSVLKPDNALATLAAAMTTAIQRIVFVYSSPKILNERWLLTGCPDPSFWDKWTIDSHVWEVRVQRDLMGQLKPSYDVALYENNGA
jgi:hypothetical protein